MTTIDNAPPKDVALHNDLVRSGAAIAELLFGKPSNAQIRKVYRLCETTDFPSFRLGGELCCRRSEVEAYLSAKRVKTKAAAASPSSHRSTGTSRP